MAVKNKGTSRQSISIESSETDALDSRSERSQLANPASILPLQPPEWAIDGSLCSSDFIEVLKLSSSRIACFCFRDKLSLRASRQEAIEFVEETPSYCLWANQSFKSAFQIDSEEDLAEKSFLSFFPNQKFREQLIEAFASNDLTLQNFDCEHSLPDGSRIVHLASLYPINENIEFKKLWVVFRDVVDSPRAVKRLQKAEQHYRTLVERPGLILIRLKPDGEYLYISPYIKDILGKNPEDLKRDPFLLRSFIHPDDVLAHEAIYRARREKRPQTVELDYRVRCTDGEYRWFREKQSPKFNEQGDVEYFDSVTMSIQEKKVLERELLQAERMKTIGSLTTAIAHEFNNHLTAVIGELGMCIEDTESHSSSSSSLIQAEKAALACSDLARQLLRFSQGSHAPAALLDLSELARETHELLPHLLPAGIEKELSLGGENFLVHGHASLIQQALVSLAMRSSAAMKGSGKLELSLRPLKLNGGSNNVDYQTLGPGEYVEVIVSDTGEEIPSRQLAQIFRPKTGQSRKFAGLALVFSVIESHGGRVHISSKRGIGTTVQFIIPRVETEKASSTSKYELNHERGHEYILIAEDDDLVLSMVRTALTLKGYKVVAAQDGEIALSKFKEHGDKIALALIDYTMPKLSGRALADKIRGINPTMPVIFTSGYNQDLPEDGTDALDNSTCFMGKPFSIPALLEQVRGMIDRSPNNQSAP